MRKLNKMGFKLIKEKTLLIEIISTPQSSKILTREVNKNYAIIRHVSPDVNESIVGKTIIFMDGIMEAKFNFDHEIDGKILTEISVNDIIGFLK